MSYFKENRHINIYYYYLYKLYLIFQNATNSERWGHLAQLCEFSLAMSVALDRINAQSFNTFKLRIGKHSVDIKGGIIS